MKSLLFLLLPFLIASCSRHDMSRQPLKAVGTTSVERQQFRAELVNKTIEAALAKELTAATSAEWEGALWGMGLARYTSESVRSAIRKACAAFFSHPPGTQRALLEAIYTLYPDDFVSESEDIMLGTKNEKLFAMAALHFSRARGWDEIPRITEAMSRQFPRWSSHPILRMLHYDLQLRISDQPPYTPPVVDLLSAPIQSGKPVLFSLQRKDRRFPGILVIRKEDGTFLRHADTAYFMIQQLALASSNLPGYITNGNTPQGIHSVQGFAVSDNQFIGPTRNVQMVLPFEVNPKTYFHAGTHSDWSRETYEAMLPLSWREYLPMFTAYYAGEAGRNEIIAHGTTIDPSFYTGEPYHPNAPTLGCLSAVEVWSPETGERISSDQQLLIDAMKSIGFERGFCVVVEIDDKQAPVTPEEVTALLTSAEAERQ